MKHFPLARDTEGILVDKLTVFENRVLERMFATEIEKATSGLRILHHFQLLIKLD
jgi:hypothetical protein